MKRRLVLVAAAIGGLSMVAAPASAQVPDNPNPPAAPVKLVFIHHSTGENWLGDPGLVSEPGGLGAALAVSNYFVSDTNYGWEVNGDIIGDRTDIGNWWEWFAGPSRDAYMAALFAWSERSWEFYTRLADDPGGENEVVMFKSCFPNSNLGGSPFDPPATEPNPLRGLDAYSEYHTVANAKGIYNDLLAYFATRPDKLFIAITAPPLVGYDTDPAYAANARAFNNWLVDEWLVGYPLNNVAVFDFYNVLTSNGGSPMVSDVNEESGNHHRLWNGVIQHAVTVNSDVSAYPSGDGWDSHPSAAGGAKAAAEFVPLLNIYYHRFKGE